MSWFQLDPHSLARRARDSGRAAPSLAASLSRGVIGFMLVSIAGFAPWAVAGTWLYNFGEFWVYVSCALVFIACSGPALHRLIIGPGSLARFYKLFGIAFAAYAAAWICCWMMIAGETGCLIGLFVGAALMGWILTRAFDAPSATLPVIAVLFVSNALGFYGGASAQLRVMRMQDFMLLLGRLHISSMMVAQLLWGAVYGICFGAGLGLAFFLCQAQARALLRDGEYSSLQEQ
ncbi:MAG: hypothetical protein M3347_15905 [Armatimonadota bacterium]|nr:hypothetical protein [Armatimonadota bacterium]